MRLHAAVTAATLALFCASSVDAAEVTLRRPRRRER